MVKIHDVREKDGSVTYVFLCEEICMSGEMTVPKGSITILPDLQEKVKTKLEELNNELKEYL